MMSITKSLKVVDKIVDEKTTKTESSIRTIKLSESTINLLKLRAQGIGASVKELKEAVRENTKNSKRHIS